MTFFFIELKMVSGLREKNHLQNFNEGEFVDNPGANDFHVQLRKLSTLEDRIDQIYNLNARLELYEHETTVPLTNLIHKPPYKDG